MGFRINRGIFQFKDAATETFINKFKIDDRDGTLVEVDADGNAVTGYLKVGEKATDADKLDGINSSQFLRSDANDTKTGDTTFTGKVTLQTNLVITEDAPTISFLDTSSEDDFYIHVNSNNFYVLRNTANSENTVDGGWDSPHPLQLEGDTNKAYIFGNLIGTAAYQASSAFDAAGAADAVEATLTPLISTAQTTADNAATAAATAQTTADTALARANGAREDTVAIGELATAAQAAADAAQATADGKLGATAKAADSNLLDGIDSSRFVYGDGSNGKSIDRRNGSANTSDSSNASGFYYGHNVTGMPTTDWWNWLTVRGNSWSGSDGYQFQLAGSFWSDDYRIRRMTSGTNHNWVSIIHSGNIGSQSVNYANSAGAVSWSNVTSKPSALGFNSWGGISSVTPHGYIDFGPANNDWAHIYTDRPNFYFNKNIYVSGSILSTRSWAQGVADTAESNATAAANARIDDELVPQITANTDAIINNRNEITTVGAAAAAAQSTADGKLGATAKAADSNLLDGLDSGAFIRSNADDNVSGNTEWQDNKQVRLGNGADFRMWHDGSHTYFRNYNHGTGNFYWQGEDTEGTNHALLYMINDVSEPYIKFYANGGEKLRTTTGGITVYGSITVDGNVSANQVFMQSITSDGTIANDKGSYLHLGGWAVGRTDASAVLVNTAYRADYATSLFDMNISRFTNNSGYITQSSIDTFAEELRGEIQTAQTTADNAATAAANAQSTADGKANASHDHDRLYISDTRGAARAPSYYNDRYAQWDFQNEADTGITAGDSWQALLTVSKWSVFDPSHKQEQLIFTGDNLYRRTATSDTAWGTSKKIWDSGNLNPIVGTSYNSSGDIITYTYADGTTSSIDIVDNNTNRYLSNASFDTSTGVLSFTVAGTSDQSVDLDGRYEELGAVQALRDELDPRVTANETNIARNATDIASRAYAGGSYAQDFAADDMRVDQWFRNTVSGKGLYNEATTQHFYSDDDNYWNVAGGTDVNGIRFRDEHGGTIRGYVYATNNNEVGFLDSDGSWAVRVVRDNYVEFRDNNEVTFRVGQGGVSGDYGTVCTHGTGKNGWEGYSINGWWVFMSSDGSNSGIYNDVDNEWMTRWYRNGATELYHNGSSKMSTTSGGISVTGTVTATSFSGSGAGLTNLNVPDQSIPVSINGEGGNILVGMNMNLDMGQIEFTLSNGQTFTAMMGR